MKDATMDSADLYVASVLEKTAANPLATYEMVCFEGDMPLGAVRVVKKNATTVELESLRSFAHTSGHGSNMLRWLVDLADAHSVAIELAAQRYGNGRQKGLPTIVLRRWYERNGFVVTGGDRSSGYLMRREPKPR